MDIAQLEAFLAIARLGSFSRAAAKLHRSQPAVSRRLSLLEQEIGAPLFERIHKRVQLTDAGCALRPHAEAVLAAAHGGMTAVRDEVGEGGGTVSLAIVGTMIDAALAADLRQFAGAGSSRLSLTTTSSENISALVREGEVALGVRYFIDAGADLQCTTIGTEKMVVVSAPNASPTGPIKDRMAQAARASWIGFTKEKAMREHFGRLLAERLRAAGIAHPSMMVVDSLSAQKRLVESGFGLGFLPYSSVRSELAAGTLVQCALPAIATTIPVSLVHRRRGYLSSTARTLMEFLRTRWENGSLRRVR